MKFLLHLQICSVCMANAESDQAGYGQICYEKYFKSNRLHLSDEALGLSLDKGFFGCLRSGNPIWLVEFSEWAE